MKYKCAICGSVDSQQDWANSQLGEYFCPDCLSNGRERPKRRQQAKSTSLWVPGLIFFLVAVAGMAGLAYFVLR